MQPEQSTNGIHLQQAGCGLTVTSNLFYVGRPGEYAEAFNPGEFSEALESAWKQPEQFSGLGRVESALCSLDTRTQLLESLNSLS